MGNLAAIYVIEGQPERAIPHLEKVAENSKTARGPNHPDTLVFMHNLAWSYAAAGRTADAMPLFEDTLKRMTAPPGPENPRAPQTRRGLELARSLKQRTEQYEQSRAAKGANDA